MPGPRSHPIHQTPDLAELIEFGKTFKVKQPLPGDIVPLLTRESEDQIELLKNKTKDASELGAKKTLPRIYTDLNGSISTTPMATPIASRANTPIVVPAKLAATSVSGAGTKSFAAQTREVDTVKAQTPQVMPATLNVVSGSPTASVPNGGGSVRGGGPAPSFAEDAWAGKGKKSNKGNKKKGNANGNGDHPVQAGQQWETDNKPGRYRNDDNWRGQSYNNNNNNNNTNSRPNPRGEGNEYQGRGRGGKFDPNSRSQTYHSNSNGGPSNKFNRNIRSNSFRGEHVFGGGLGSPPSDSAQPHHIPFHPGHEGSYDAHYGANGPAQCYTAHPPYITAPYGHTGLYSPDGAWYPPVPSHLMAHHVQAHPFVPHQPPPPPPPEFTRIFQELPPKPAMPTAAGKTALNPISGNAKPAPKPYQTPTKIPKAYLAAATTKESTAPAQIPYTDSRPVQIRLESVLTTIRYELEYINTRTTPGTANALLPTDLPRYLASMLELVTQADDATKVWAAELDIVKKERDFYVRAAKPEEMKNGYVGFLLGGESGEGESVKRIDLSDFVAPPPMIRDDGGVVEERVEKKEEEMGGFGGKIVG